MTAAIASYGGGRARALGVEDEDGWRRRFGFGGSGDAAATGRGGKERHKEKNIKKGDQLEAQGKSLKISKKETWAVVKEGFEQIKLRQAQLRLGRGGEEEEREKKAS